MFRKLFKLLSTISEHYFYLGFEGIRLLVLRVLKKHPASVRLSFIKYPIYLRLNTTDLTVFYQVFLSQNKNFILKYDPKIIIDCGANIGLSSVYFANKFPSSKIYAIEMENENFKQLSLNTASYNNITGIHKAVWNKNSDLQLVKGFDGGEWSYEVKEAMNIATTDRINSITLNELLLEYNINQIDVLKIDIEGAEKELFEDNYLNWLSVTKVIIIELHDHIKLGCYYNFFKALKNFKYQMRRNNENYIIYMLHD